VAAPAKEVRPILSNYPPPLAPPPDTRAIAGREM